MDGVYCGLGACEEANCCGGKLGVVMVLENPILVAIGAVPMLVAMGALPIPMLEGRVGCCDVNKYAFYVHGYKQKQCADSCFESEMR